MCFVHCTMPGVASPDGPKPSATRRPLHRLGTVRRRQGISRRSVARRLKIDAARVKLLERETTDMLLSRLYEWQEVLEVPVTELLVEAGDPLSEPVLRRAQLVRLMKTALSIMEVARQKPVRRMAQNLIDQLNQLMPELEDVGPWPAVGKRRRLDECGVAVERRISDDVFLDLVD